jgi:8-oxo-dGTP pyrophosphatase MutT (NUDIX family)
MRTIQRDIVGAFIFTSDEKLLLGKGGVFADSLYVPGGGIEQNESLEEAVIREILEETGIDLKDEKIEKLEGVNQGESEKVLRDTGERVFVKMKFHDYLVILEKTSSQINLQLDDDFTDAGWHDVSSLGKLKLSPATLSRLQSLGYLNIHS